jgi:hypothetical protein
MINPETDRVLITDAAGAIGTALRAGLRDAADRGDWEWPEHGGSFPSMADRPAR